MSAFDKKGPSPAKLPPPSAPKGRGSAKVAGKRTTGLNLKASSGRRPGLPRRGSATDPVDQGDIIAEDIKDPVSGAQPISTKPPSGDNAKAPRIPTPKPLSAPRVSMPIDPESSVMDVTLGQSFVDMDWEDSSGEIEAGQFDDYDGDEFADGPDPYVGTTIGDRYVVDAVLGEGGMGMVYLCHHKVIEKQLAMKILHADLARDKEAVGRFVREAQAASSIGNDHIVDISDFGETPDGSTYFVMEYLKGIDLGDKLEDEGSFEEPFVIDVCIQMCDGLAAAHAQDIVHRDLKPDNVTLVTHSGRDNFAKILDFGIAKVSTGTSKEKLTMAGAVFGTPHYMSPEQAAGAAVDHRTDIYSLGVMMYEMTSGDLPFNADNFMGILTQHMYKAPVPLRSLPGPVVCSPGLEAVILKCLSKKPEGRYQTMEELGADLRRLESGEIPDAVRDMMSRSGDFNVPADYFNNTNAGTSTTVEPTELTPEPKKKSPVALVFAAAAVVAIGGAVALATGGSETRAGTPSPATTSTAAAAAMTTTAAQPTAPAATTKPVAEEKNFVMLVTNPPATGIIGDKKIQLPERIEVPKGKTVKVKIERQQYKKQVVELDGTKKRVEVTLKPLTRNVLPRRRRAPKPKPGGEVVNPWGH